MGERQNSLLDWCRQNPQRGQQLYQEYTGYNSSKQPLDITKITYGSSKQVFWKCKDCNAVYLASPNERRYGKNCPKCGNKKSQQPVQKVKQSYKSTQSSKQPVQQSQSTIDVKSNASFMEIYYELLGICKSSKEQGMSAKIDRIKNIVNNIKDEATLNKTYNDIWNVVTKRLPGCELLEGKNYKAYVRFDEYNDYGTRKCTLYVEEFTDSVEEHTFYPWEKYKLNYDCVNDLFVGDELSHIILKKGIKVIPDGAFDGWNALLTMCGKVEYKQAFYKLIIPTSVTKIGNNAFRQNNLWTKLVIPSSVTTIGHSAFEDCQIQDGLVLPDSLITIGNCAFRKCKIKGGLKIPDSVITIGDGAFMNCKFSGSLKLGKSIKSIESGAFNNCEFWRDELVLPNSLTKIGSWAFRGCKEFYGDLIIPDSIKTIESHAFEGTYFDGKLMLPNSVTKICNYAFSECRHLHRIKLPESLTYIGDCAFRKCTGFYGDLVIPNSVTHIGRKAFSGCSGFDGKLVIPESVKYIGEKAFKKCSRIKSGLEIPSTVTEVGEKVFAGCNIS
jgi:hypothetical protein